jgi:hypothetical protein
MSNFSYFAAIYDTTLIREEYKKVVADPVKVEFFKGVGKTFTAHITPNRILPTGIGSQVAFFPTLQLNPERFYISLTARSLAAQVRDALSECETAIDSCISDLAIIYSPYIFNFPVYRGFVVGENEARGAAYVRLENPVVVNPCELEGRDLPRLKVARKLDPNVEARYGLMSRFFAKSLVYEPSEEKMLFLWTILEIYPMTDTSDIRPISELVADILGRAPELVKEKLGIGKIFGLRSDLIHDGKLTLSREQLGAVIEKLENICTVVLRHISGEPYRGVLEKYF